MSTRAAAQASSVGTGSGRAKYSGPACQQCKKRKSRCMVDPQAEAGSSCLQCQGRGSECSLLTDPVAVQSKTELRLQRESRHGRAAARKRQLPRPSAAALPAPADTDRGQIPRVSHQESEGRLLALDEPEGHNPHIMGPDVASDSQVLADYLSTMQQGTGSTRMIRPAPGSRSGTVIFTRVQKRPLGMRAAASNLASEKLHIIEKIFEPWTAHLVALYFAKINVCFPLLDEPSFKSEYNTARDHISPALLANIYANTIAFWHGDRKLSRHRCPDTRFVWNLASEALYSEMLMSPGLSTVTTLLLNTAGRPSTSMFGNGVQVGSAVSLAHSLGLNRNPISWEIPQSEKYLRMRIWWCLLIHDRWTSVAYGTPPHIRRTQYDVPSPTLECLACQTSEAAEASGVFISLVSLTGVLDHYLEHVYLVDKAESRLDARNVGDRLESWVEALDGRSRHIVLRGTQLEVSGAGNLRLAYLSAKLLVRRIELNADKEQHGVEAARLENRYLQVRRTAEDIVLMVQELREEQLGGFWLPVAGFALSSTITSLLRCALEMEASESTAVCQTQSLRLAQDLLTALREHREKYAWDIADIALSQHTELVEKLLSAQEAPQPEASDNIINIQETFVPDPDFINTLFPSLWDNLHSA